MSAETPRFGKKECDAAMPWDLEPEYCMWVMNLTSQRIHDKADIATILALYERAITAARAELAALAEVAGRNAAIQEGVGHNDSAAAWRHMQNKLTAAIAVPVPA